jgi:hypothetical protein
MTGAGVDSTPDASVRRSWWHVVTKENPPVSVRPSIIERVPTHRPGQLAVLLRGSSMRFMETGLAILAIATAVLLSQLQ